MANKPIVNEPMPQRSAAQKFAIPIALWLMAASLCAAIYFYGKSNSGSAGSSMMAGSSPNDPPGAVLVDVPWKHLPHVDRFELTAQDGSQFDSASFAGKPYFVSFFFAQCPTFCRDLNNQVDRLNKQLRKEDVGFVTISVDPENDTQQVLERYAEDYDTTPDRWAFLTGQMFRIKQIGEHVFNVVVDKNTHTDNILLVDKWGRYRDRFKWDDPYDMKRLVEVAKEIGSETEPPMDAIVHTRNVMAGQAPTDLNLVPWLREFHLTDHNNEAFYSRDLTGEVWIGNFFFTSCPGICKQQNEYLRNLRERLGKNCAPIVSITTDPSNDTTSVLNKFAQSLDPAQSPPSWKFCTGQSQLTKRIGSEFFHAHASDDHHSSRLFVVDRWGVVRGSFDWQETEQEIEMLELISKLRAEKVPTFPAKKKRRKGSSEDGADNDEGEGDKQ